MRKLILKLAVVTLCLVTAIPCGKEDETTVPSTDTASEIDFRADGSVGNQVIVIDTNQQE
jgi:hypothetical protein